MITAALLICLSPIATDGDTFKCGTDIARIRVFGVDAPEKNTAGYAQSTAYHQTLINGGLICELKGASYNRTVALCRNSSGLEIGRALVVARQAREDCVYSKNAYGTCR